MSDRKIIDSWVRNAYVYHTFHNKTPMQVIQNLQDLMETHKNRELFFRHEETEEVPGQYTINIYERREENDREYKARVAKENKAKAKDAALSKEFEEYQRLKKKFEDEERMNERIKELEKQCWDNQTNHLNAEKFAELIVKECVICAEREWIRNGDTEHNRAVSKVIGSIKQHFGVEE